MKETSKGLSFSRLPTELRLQIYELLFSPDEDSEHDGSLTIDWYGRVYGESLGVYPAIIATCKQTASEATAVLYNQQTFGFRTVTAMLNWLDAIGPENAKLVRDAELRDRHISAHFIALPKLGEVLSRCPGLRRLRVLVTMSPGTCLGGSHRPYAYGFLVKVLPWLKIHPLLGEQEALSRYEKGFRPEKRGPDRKVQFPDAIDVTFVANASDGRADRDGGPFNIDEAVKVFHSRLREDYDGEFNHLELDSETLGID